MNNYDPYIGFMKGNIFENLYEPYKNYNFQQVNPNSEKEYQLLLVQTYSFNLNDIDLYLDTHPNDTNMINMYNEFSKLYKQALSEYELKYGPITFDSTSLNKTPWAWNNEPWPWEVNANV